MASPGSFPESFAKLLLKKLKNVFCGPEWGCTMVEDVESISPLAKLRGSAMKPFRRSPKVL